MKIYIYIAYLLLLYGIAYSSEAKEQTEKVLVYCGASDASAAAAINDDMFVVADDENNILRVYKTGDSEMPVFSYDLTSFLEVEPDYPEADIEGATKIGNRIYWITSHGRNEDGKIRPSRYRFFATDIEIKDGDVYIQPVGRPYKTLVQGMLKDENLRSLGLDKSTQFDAVKLSKKQRGKLAPKEQGLNIEALCASADGKILYIGFRNPRPVRKNTPNVIASPSEGISNGASANEKALVIPLYNANAIVEKSVLSVLGKPILWDLNNLGIRSMEYSAFHKAYFIIAGPHYEGRKFALYRWSGSIDEQPKLVRDLSFQRDFTPEVIVCFGNLDKLLILSDDGSLPVKIDNLSECMQDRLNDDGTCPNKFLTDPNKKTFRAIWLKP